MAGRRPNGKKLRWRKRLKNAQTPQRQVHAVLGGDIFPFIYHQVTLAWLLLIGLGLRRGNLLMQKET